MDSLTSLLLRLLLWLYVPFLLAPILLVPAVLLLWWRITGEFPICLAVPLLLLLFVTMIQMLVASAALWGEIPDATDMEFEVAPNLIEPLYIKAEDIADQLDLLPPHEIRLSAITPAAAYEDRRGRRILLIGGMALACLTDEALEGVMAHELAHFTAGDTRLSQQAMRVVHAMMIMEEQFSILMVCWLNPVSWLILLYHRLFQMVWARNSRQQEFAADRYVVHRAGKEAAATALMRIELLEQMPWTRIDSIARTAAGMGDFVQDLFSEQWHRARHTSRSEWEDAGRKALKKRTKLLDSHPSLRDRLKAIRVKPKKAIELALKKTGKPAYQMFPHWQELEAVMSQELMIIYRAIHRAKREAAQIFLGRPL